MILLKAVEKIYHCKDESLTMEDVYEDILRYLSEDAEFAKWNISTAAMKYASFKHGKCQLDEGFDTQIDIGAVEEVISAELWIGYLLHNVWYLVLFHRNCHSSIN